nr:MAG TPA: hypothetical protein [Bacteriophage sp.]
MASFRIFIASSCVLESNQSASFSALVIPKTEQAPSDHWSKIGVLLYTIFSGKSASPVYSSITVAYHGICK